MTTATREPRAAAGAVSRIGAILSARGINPNAGTAANPVPEQVTALDLADARIPPRYRHALPNHPRVTAWIAEIASTGRSGPGGVPGIATGPSLLIAGPTGTGKTHHAYGAIRGLLGEGVRLRWEATTLADLYAAQRPQHGTDPEQQLWRLARSPLLLLDDLGAAKQSQWTEELTYRLVNHRYNQLLPTLVTTNLPVAELRDAVGDRVASRLSEMTERVILTGRDRRRHPAG
ncbi:ATP-binding protein [Streptomyces sp. 150FB]|uniref:ATP-binding protein n=1 Tax=Streptomyces sp. 150FB TaxID=1576605 RepID=UPI0005891669|nr:ATP-binding protein [Streptomyces sp. 150FB]KIF75234.1 ATP-binding protein [Streptomyces sp. 150FB]